MPGKAWQEREKLFHIAAKIASMFVRSFVRWFVCLPAYLFVCSPVCLSLFAHRRLTLFWQFKVDETFYLQAVPKSA